MLFGAWLALAMAPAHAADSSAGQSTATITGRAQNAANGQFLNTARGTMQGTELVAFTDETGSYRLTH